jgi:hypothetical protein
MIRARGDVRPGGPRPDIKRLRDLPAYDSMFINSELLTIRLSNGVSICLKPEGLKASGLFHVTRSDLVAFRNRMMALDQVLTGFDFGAFACTEYKKNKFAASAFVWSAATPANWYESKGALKCFGNATAEDTLRAEALLTYEFWLGTKALSESVMKMPLIGEITRFNFGRELNLWINPHNLLTPSEN